MKFSILVPAYKPQFLAECIESILAQTYGDWELIIVNDASPYDIDSIVGRFSDSRIRYYKREKGFGAERLVDNWNDCLGYATGEYVINMGDDDKLTKKCLYNYHKHIAIYKDYDVYHVRTGIIDEKSELVDILQGWPTEESTFSMIWHAWRYNRKSFMGDWLFKTNKLREKGGYINLPCAWASDDITAYMMSGNKGVSSINKLGFLYRQTSLTISKQNKHNFGASVSKSVNWIGPFTFSYLCIGL